MDAETRTAGTRLEGRVAVVTGGTRGLGAVIAEAFLAEGARVVRAARKPITEVTVDGGDDRDERSVFHQADVTDPRSVAALMEASAERFGRIDVVVANAGASVPGPVARLTDDAWDLVLRTNVSGVFHCTRAAVPHMAAGGRIINVSSALATRITPGAAAYCASKAAVDMFTRVCAVELGPRGITVNCLSPGIIDEGMGRDLIANEKVWPDYGRRLAAGRPGSGPEVAHAAVFLASDESSYVSGHVLEVTGGLNW